MAVFQILLAMIAHLFTGAIPRKNCGRCWPVMILCAVLAAGAAPLAAEEPVAPAKGHSVPGTESKRTYYVIKRISITTDSGVRSIAPGTPVEVIEKNKRGVKIKLPDGEELVTAPDHLTLDADAANRRADQERTAREAHDAAIRKWADAEAARRGAEAEANEQAMREAQKKIPPDSSASAPSSSSQPSGLIGTALDARSGIVAKVAHPKPPPKK